jgi:predicted phosphate transport protein (TIGR00153 family)
MKFLFPKTIDFFELFDHASRNVIKGASLLVAVLQDMDNLEMISKEIRESEKEGDMMTHDIIKKLNKTFITPIDREDLHALATKIDDVIDMIWACVDRFTLFKLSVPTKEAIDMAKEILTTTEMMSKAVIALRDKKYSFVQEYCIEINRLENRIDRLYRDALCRLFDEVKDPIAIIKWKEVYEYLENAADACEDVANILEAIVLKYA